MRAVIMDGSEDVRALVRSDLERAGVEVVAVAADAPAAVWCSAEYGPDLVVLGQPLSGPTAFAAAAAISAAGPATRVVVFNDWAAALPGLDFGVTAAA